MINVRQVASSAAQNSIDYGFFVVWSRLLIPEKDSPAPIRGLFLSSTNSQTDTTAYMRCDDMRPHRRAEQVPNYTNLRHNLDMSSHFVASASLTLRSKTRKGRLEWLSVFVGDEIMVRTKPITILAVEAIA